MFRPETQPMVSENLGCHWLSLSSLALSLSSAVSQPRKITARMQNNPPQELRFHQLTSRLLPQDTVRNGYAQMAADIHICIDLCQVQTLLSYIPIYLFCIYCFNKKQFSPESLHQIIYTLSPRIELIRGEPCSKPFHHLNAISRPYAFTLRNPYATTTGAYAGDYGQHNLTRRLRDGVSCRKMTPDCSASLRIPMSQGKYIQMCFFCPGICLKASLVTGFGVRG